MVQSVDVFVNVSSSLYCTCCTQGQNRCVHVANDPSSVTDMEWLNCGLNCHLWSATEQPITCHDLISRVSSTSQANMGETSSRTQTTKRGQGDAATFLVGGAMWLLHLTARSPIRPLQLMTHTEPTVRGHRIDSLKTCCEAIHVGASHLFDVSALHPAVSKMIAPSSTVVLSYSHCLCLSQLTWISAPVSAIIIRVY